MEGRAASTIISPGCRPSSMLVEIVEAGGNAGHALLSEQDRLDVLHGLLDQRPARACIGAVLRLGDVEEGLLGLAEDACRRPPRSRSSRPSASRAQSMISAQQVFLADDVDVVLGVGGGGRGVDQPFEERRAADLVQPAAVAQALGDGQQVDRPALVHHVARQLEERLVGGNVEGLGRRPALDAQVHHARRRPADRAQDAALRLLAVGRNPVDAACRRAV